MRFLDYTERLRSPCCGATEVTSHYDYLDSFSCSCAVTLAAGAAGRGGETHPVPGCIAGSGGLGWGRFRGILRSFPAVIYVGQAWKVSPGPSCQIVLSLQHEAGLKVRWCVCSRVHAGCRGAATRRITQAR